MEEIIVNVKQQNGMIDFNFDEIKARLEDEMNFYTGMIFTEDTKKEAKTTVAELRKLKKTMDDRRKEVKETYMSPYVEFESKVKELCALVDKPIDLINQQINDFDKKRIEERRVLISNIYKENISGMEEFLPLEKIYNQKWENATTTQKSITDDIQAHVLNVKNDLETIRSLQSEFEGKGIETYKKTLRLADAVQCINSYEKQKEEILRRQKEQEEIAAAKKAAEEEKKIETVAIEPVEEPVKEPAKEPVRESNKAVYEIEADAFQIAKLEASMREYGIGYRRIQ